MIKHSSVLRFFVVLGVLAGCLYIAIGVASFFYLFLEALYRSKDILDCVVALIISVGCIVVGFVISVWTFKYFNLPVDWEGNISRDKEEQRRMQRGIQIIIFVLVNCLVFYFYIQFTWHSHLPYEVSLYDSCMSENKKRVNSPSGIRADQKVSQQRNEKEKAADPSFCAFLATMNSEPWKFKSVQCWAGISDSSPEFISCLQKTMLDARELLAEEGLVTNFDKIDKHINNTGNYHLFYNYIR